MVISPLLTPFLPAVFEAAFDVTGTPATAGNARVSVAKVAKICGVFFAKQNFARPLFFLLELLRNLFLSSFVAGWMRNQSKAKTGSRKVPAGLPAWRHATSFMHKSCMICTIADNRQPIGFRYKLDLPVTYPETTRRCRGVRVGLGPAAPTQTKPYRALFAQQGHHNESERTSIWN